MIFSVESEVLSISVKVKNVNNRPTKCRLSFGRAEMFVLLDHFIEMQENIMKSDNIRNKKN